MGLRPDRVKPKTIKSKDWLARNQDKVSEFGDMSLCGLLFQWASTIKIQLSVLVEYKIDLIIIHWKWTCSRHDIAEKLRSWCSATITHSLKFIYPMHTSCSWLLRIIIFLLHTCSYLSLQGNIKWLLNIYQKHQFNRGTKKIYTKIKKNYPAISTFAVQICYTNKFLLYSY